MVMLNSGNSRRPWPASSFWKASCWASNGWLGTLRWPVVRAGELWWTRTGCWQGSPSPPIKKCSGLCKFSRVEILESQLTTYGKAMTEDKLREETKRLMCDKESYQTAAKENLKRLVDEKLEASKRLKEVSTEPACLTFIVTGWTVLDHQVETSLSNLEEEYSSLHQLYDKVRFQSILLPSLFNFLWRTSLKTFPPQVVEENKRLSEKMTGLAEEVKRILV